MLIYGRLESLFEGREYNGVKPMIAQVLDKTGFGRSNLCEVQLDAGSVSALRSQVDKMVLLDFTEVNGRGQNGSYTLRVDGRLASPDVLDKITKAGIGFVGVGPK